MACTCSVSSISGQIFDVDCPSCLQAEAVYEESVIATEERLVEQHQIHCDICNSIGHYPWDCQ